MQNKTLGFGGRVIDDSLPKYINTAERINLVIPEIY